MHVGAERTMCLFKKRDRIAIARARLLLGAAVATIGLGAGCGVSLTVANNDNANENYNSVIDGNRDQDATSGLGKTFGEPNDSFSEAVVAVADASGAFRLEGTVYPRGDLDVYQLGAMAPGDRMIIDASTAGSSLDVSIALFDSEERLVSAKDDRTVQDFDSFIDLIARHEGNPYYLVVTHSAFAPSAGFTGTYQIDIEVMVGQAVPPPMHQLLKLDFDGGEIDSPALGSMTIRPFSAERISPAYTGQTELLKTLILEGMEQNYERFNVTVVTTDDPPPPPGTEFSTIFFGGFNPSAFGIAESVDLYNADFCDDAIIYAETFSPSIFSGVPTVAELAVAIANVGAHEAGHLLGLNHVSDDLALMDDRSAADAFIEDQEFMEAPLSSDIMQIGTQDAVLLLNEIVGPAAP